MSSRSWVSLSSGSDKNRNLSSFSAFSVMKIWTSSHWSLGLVLFDLMYWGRQCHYSSPEHPCFIFHNALTFDMPSHAIITSYWQPDTILVGLYIWSPSFTSASNLPHILRIFGCFSIWMFPLCWSSLSFEDLTNHVDNRWTNDVYITPFVL